MSLYKDISRLKMKIQKELNNTYIWSNVALDAIAEKTHDSVFLKKVNFKVPKTRVTSYKAINRSEEAAKELMSSAFEYDLRYSIFTYVIAQFEAYLAEIIETTLKYEPRKLLGKVDGIKHTSAVNISDIILSESRDDIIESIIKMELMNIFYASPKKQSKYFSEVLNISVDEIFWNYWFNYKAARDLIVHNGGIVNDVYNKKVTSDAKLLCGEKIVISHEYYCDTIRHLKSFAGMMPNCVK
ncbi:MAG: hypothetical protein CVU98_10330 [Firmicutes bacterium HGW-Firmicutes-3]|nr:MAG: hypothetical protein CVU98_10330 [Firmicutes bacterium HGW-Firmicutes-3]